MTEIHNEGCECELCRWANSTATIPAPDFDHEWREAPESRRRYTEKDEAEHWFLRGAWAGIQFAQMRAALEMNDDLRKMRRAGKE